MALAPVDMLSHSGLPLCWHVLHHVRTCPVQNRLGDMERLTCPSCGEHDHSTRTGSSDSLATEQPEIHSEAPGAQSPAPSKAAHRTERVTVCKRPASQAFKRPAKQARENTGEPSNQKEVPEGATHAGIKTGKIGLSGALSAAICLVLSS